MISESIIDTTVIPKARSAEKCDVSLTHRAGRTLSKLPPWRVPSRELQPPLTKIPTVHMLRPLYRVTDTNASNGRSQHVGILADPKALEALGHALDAETAARP